MPPKTMSQFLLLSVLPTVCTKDRLPAKCEVQVTSMDSIFVIYLVAQIHCNPHTNTCGPFMVVCGHVLLGASPSRSPCAFLARAGHALPSRFLSLALNKHPFCDVLVPCFCIFLDDFFIEDSPPASC